MHLFRSMPHALRVALPVALLAAPAAYAQNPLQNGRPAVVSPTVAGMGDASVAFPTRGASFFYNPAHVAQTAGLKPQVTVLGIQARGSSNLKDYFDFINDDLQPAIDRGVDNLSAAERDTLYSRALRVTRDRAFAGTDLVPATVTMRLGPVAVGAGAFASANGRFRSVPGGAGVPTVQFSAVTDVSGVASAAVDLTPFGVAGLSVGTSARYTHRRVTIKDKPIDAFSQGEQPYLHEASALSLDLGALYDVPLPMPGRLTVGASLLDVVGGDFDYTFNDRYYCGEFPPYCEVDTAPDAQLIAQEEALARASYAVNPSYRVGAAYTAPRLFGVLPETGIALDYVGYSDPQIEDQPFLAHLSLGAQVQVLRMLALRAGLNQGYVSLGAGAKLGPLALDYAFYGFEQGTNPGDEPSWQHMAALKFVF